MNHSDRRIVYILPGFEYFTVGNRKVPDRDILLRLIQPNIDLKTATLVVSSTLNSEEEIKSQSILREHSNLIVSRLAEMSLLDPAGVALSIGLKLEQLIKEAIAEGYISEDFKFSFDGLRFHIARLDYLDYFFLPPPKYDKILEISTEFTRFYYQWVKTGKCESKKIEKDIEDSEERKNVIRKNFTEYEISEVWHDFFMYAAQRYYRDELLELVSHKSKGFSEIVDISRKNYRQPHENRLVKYSIPWQCPFCQRWYEREPGGNGKPRAKCKPCFKNWDNDRRRKKNP